MHNPFLRVLSLENTPIFVKYKGLYWSSIISHFKTMFSFNLNTNKYMQMLDISSIYVWHIPYSREILDEINKKHQLVYLMNLKVFHSFWLKGQNHSSWLKYLFVWLRLLECIKNVTIQLFLFNIVCLYLEKYSKDLFTPISFKKLFFKFET